MPAIENAIVGQPNLTRKRAKYARVAQEAFPTIPNWMKTWTVAQAKTYIDTSVVDLASARVVLKGLAQFCIVLRDILQQYHEET